MKPAKTRSGAGAQRRSRQPAGETSRPSWTRTDNALNAIAVIAVALLITAGAFQRIWASDFWWQYRTGALVASSGPPSVDTFSFTVAGSPWIELRWLFFLVIHTAVGLAGFPAAVVLKWLAILISFGLVTAVAATRRTAVVACAALTIAALASSQRFFVRPELATFLFFALFVWVIGRYLAGERRILWLLPALQVLWVNTHTLFSLGPLLVGLLLVVSVVEHLDARSSLAARSDGLQGTARAAARNDGPQGTARAAPRTDGPQGTARAAGVAGTPADAGTRARTRDEQRSAPPPGTGETASEPIGPVSKMMARAPACAPIELALRRIRTIALVFAATTLACLVNPYGAKSFGYAWLLVQEVHGSVFKDVSGELRSPFSFSQTYTAVPYYEALIGLCVVSAILNIRKLSPFWTLLVISQLYLSVTAIRNLPLFALAAVPFIVMNVRDTPLAGHKLVVPLLPAARRLLAAAIVAACSWYAYRFVTDRFNVAQGDTNQFGAGIATHRYPDGAVRFLKERSIEGPIFNTMLEGGYMLAHDYKVFIDGRLEVYGERFLDRFLRVQSDPGAWNAAVKEFGLKAALIDLQSPLVRQLLSSEDWSLVYFDEVAAVFAPSPAPAPIRSRQEFETAIAALRARLPRPVPFAAGSWLSRVTSPIPYLKVAGFLLAAGQPEPAEEFARDALSAWPETDSAHAMLAHVLEARRDFTGAVREYDAALAIAPDNIANRRLLGFALFKAGRLQEALPALESTVRDVPSDGLAWAMLTRIHADSNRPREATACAERAVALGPRNPEYRKNLGRLYAVTGNLQGAVLTLRRAYTLDPRDSSLCRDLAALLVKTGNSSEALVFVQRGLALKPDDPDLPKIREAAAARSR